MLDTMSSEAPELLQRIRAKFEDSRDERVRELALGEPGVEEISVLLAAYGDAADPANFNIRYLAPGRSGAKVFLLNHVSHLPVVVKVGARADIEREARNYRVYGVEETLSPEVRPALKFHREGNDHALVVYSWAGGWEHVRSYRDYFVEAAPDALVQVTESLMADMFRWHRVGRAPDLPFDQWSWDNKTLEQIRRAVATWPETDEVKRRVLGVLEEQRDWRDALTTRRGSRAVCHGDLNCNNVLLAERGGIPFPKVIDFASVDGASSPARDWAKFEREVKLRCLRELIPDAAEYADALALMDEQLARGGVTDCGADARVAKTCQIVATVRRRYEDLTANTSDIPRVEYLYYLMCWTLAYLANQDGQAEVPEVQNAILSSALNLIGQIDAELLRKGKVVAAAGSKGGRDGYLERLGNEFVSQLRIAGHLEDANHMRRAMYLDENLYVHRQNEESALLTRIEEFSAPSTSKGGWVSIIGDSGHGKSSLLWFLYSMLKGDERLRVVPVLAQMQDGLIDVVAKVAEPEALPPVPGPRTLFLVDTLDILVGGDDAGLAAALSAIRARGWLVVTTSRRQEAERLERIVQCDTRVDLRRYRDEEAREAIINYVRVAYPTAPAEEQERQSETLWNILEQQRAVRELDLEPLILRMIFEAYAPEEIPKDLNTQKVYKKYWAERVLSDRVVKEVAERVERELVCRLIASAIVFGDSRSDKLAVGAAADAWRARHGGEFPLRVVEKLISSGVLQWADGAGSVRFFHQTFLEYAAAYDVLSAGASEAAGRTDFLLEAAARFDFFRAPTLKQLVVQAFESSPDLAHRLMERLQRVNNALSAQIAFEVIGKARDAGPSVELCERWVAEESGMLQGVVCDVVRHYPGGKTEDGLRFLRPLLGTQKTTAIYSMCGETFARVAPGLVRRFLRGRLEQVKSGDDDEKQYYNKALCAVVGRGETAALEELRELLPHLKPGQRAGLVQCLADAANVSNAGDLVLFIQAVLTQVADAGRRFREVWVALLNFARRVRQVAPDEARRLAEWLRGSDICMQSDAAAIFGGQIQGLMLLTPELVDAALANMISTDHRVRLLNGGILSGAPAEFTPLIMDRMLALDPSHFEGTQVARTLFEVAANLEDPEPDKLFEFVERWAPAGHGAGAPLRRIFGSLAETKPDVVRDWLMRGLTSVERTAAKGFFRAFTILLQESPLIFNTEMISQAFEIGLKSEVRAQRLLAGSVGAVAAVDEKLAGGLFSTVFEAGPREYRVAAVNSLRFCLNSRPEFVLSQGEKVLTLFRAKADTGVLDTYLVVLKEFPRERSGELLRALENWFTSELFRRLDNEKVLSELLGVLKVACLSDPGMALKIGQRVPIISKGVAGGLAALYDQVSARGEDDRGLLAEVLEGVRSISRYDQMRMGNALHRILPRLSRGLGVKKVAEWALETAEQIENEQSLNTFIKAALEIPGWGEEATEVLLRSGRLPDSTVGIILAKRREG